MALGGVPTGSAKSHDAAIVAAKSAVVTNAGSTLAARTLSITATVAVFETKADIATVPALVRETGLMKSVRQSLTKQYHESFRALRRQLGRVGATVMRFNDGDPVQIVLDRLDRLRGMRSRR